MSRSLEPLALGAVMLGLAACRGEGSGPTTAAGAFGIPARTAGERDAATGPDGA